MKRSQSAGSPLSIRCLRLPFYSLGFEFTLILILAPLGLGQAASPSPDDGGASLPAGERHLRLSLSPRLDQKHSKWGASSWPPGASLSCRPRKDSEEHRFWGKSYYLPSGRQASATGSTVGEEGGDEEGDGEGHGAAALGSSGVGVRVVVTADYGGEVKVFLGLGDVS